MKRSIFKEDRIYRFSDYFTMTHPSEEIAAEFGYSLSIEMLALPSFDDYDPAIIQALNNTYSHVFPQISLNSEIAKREFLIAPLLLELAKQTAVKINVEYTLEVNDKLGGILDYLLRAQKDLVVIEAKKKDLDGGFNQLLAELIALDQYEDEQDHDVLYGAVTLGDIWRFAILDRKQKHIRKNIRLHTIPDDTDEIFSILMGISH